MRRALPALAVVLGLVVAGGGSISTVAQDDPRGPLRTGDYHGALAAYAAEAAKDPRGAPVHRAWMRTLAEVGRYAEAEEVARGFVARSPRSVELEAALGEVLQARGRLAEAEAAFEKAITGRASDALVAEVSLGVLHFERGDRAEATRRFQRLITAYNASDGLSSEELVAVGTACRYLGADDPQLFKDALKAFDEAIAADPQNMDARVRLAKLFLEKYNSADAKTTLEEALEQNHAHPRALVAMARLKDFDGQFGVLELLERSLQVNPHLAEARVFRAEVRLAQEDFDAAAREAEGVLAENAASLPALSVLAAARYLQGDRPRFDEVLKKAQALNPRPVELYTSLAEACVRNRLYAEAVSFAQRAVALDPRSWRGLGILGINQLRLGAIEEGQKNLAASFAGDPYDVWIKNTLDLLDTFPQYEETKTEHFRLIIHGKEAALLAPYVSEVAEESYAQLTERYRYRPTEPIRVEVYPSHGDFSVRTVGLAGRGALGACFGPVLAIDSPSAREMGRFNWASTLWHEVAHTITLGATGNKLPRWIGEGLSVLEERRARPGWGDDVTMEFLETLKAGKLLPIGDLNDGFVRPTGPDQVAISYYQASLVVERIEAERGFAAVLGLMNAYREGRSTAAAFQEVLGTTLEDFDRAFFAHLNERFAGPLISLDEFKAAMASGTTLFRQKKFAEALPQLERARTLFPQLGGEASAYWLLAAIHQQQSEPRLAADELSKLVAIDDRHYRAHVELAKLQEELGDAAAAAATLERALYIWPFETTLHERLAALHETLGDRSRVVRARRSLVALDPVDRPEALYQLALALLEAGDAAAARREVLRALELAPRFQRAQELLLKLHRAGRPAQGESG
jgi:tetratricopeptide (TPR) repeat protein